MTEHERMSVDELQEFTNWLPKAFSKVSRKWFDDAMSHLNEETTARKKAEEALRLCKMNADNNKDIIPQLLAECKKAERDCAEWKALNADAVHRADQAEARVTELEDRWSSRLTQSEIDRREATILKARVTELESIQRCDECMSELVVVQEDNHFTSEQYDCPVCILKARVTELEAELRDLGEVFEEWAPEGDIQS